jgi:hypothetical protein
MPALQMLAAASPPFSLVRLTFDAHHAATTAADRSLTHAERRIN